MIIACRWAVKAPQVEGVLKSPIDLMMLPDTCIRPYHFWVSDWYQCQKMSACGLGRPCQDLSDPLSRMSVWEAAASRNSWGRAGRRPRTGRCCAWSWGNHADYAVPGCRWPGTRARRRTPRHQSHRPRAGWRWGRGTRWGRWWALKWRRTRASHPARTPKELQWRWQER